MTAGDVVLLNFPFSDLSGAKLRPVVVLAVVDRDDFIVAQITSQRKADRHAVELTNGSFTAGGLRVTSFARSAKLFTAHRRLVAKRIGRIRDDMRDAVRDAAIEVIRGR
ncbi:MAG: type II toxin-antitoxin system PemK/MazF family toxin [Planctomycetota bacterium]|nr:type II toxin-antitoxin system PemK/MazF family toxin [Planctomycetota bacterium]